ncbi:MAG: nicotinate-nucleotide adenylyltransferase [Gammaproteobacteria bacterium]|nr:nicotinate-nucleotide adenylyltransferase [Gammaproteobacteria bacterium]NNJ50585.1 nicotinate-nucleotide adenylyltransferase [Gammaproteobacteria bacterium]
MIGIFGGTFDPVHYGHIKTAFSVKQALNLSQLRFIPNRMPPHRAKPWLSVEQRLQLLHTALLDYPDVIIDERELDRDGPSYMVDTLASLKQEFPQEALCLVIGMDAFFGITTWFRWRSLFDLCHLVVIDRPGFDSASIKQQFDAADYTFLHQRMSSDVDTLTTQENGRILLQSVPQLDISSTMIRDNLSHEELITQWMPEPVYKKLRGFINDDR